MAGNGDWINTYAGFEGKQNRTNRLILSFYKLGESPKKVKAFCRYLALIPSKGIHYENTKKLEKILSSWKNDYRLSKCPLKIYLSNHYEKYKDAIEKKYGVQTEIVDSGFNVFHLFTPNNRALFKRILGKGSALSSLQKGNYDKILKLSGFYPERKVILDQKLEKAFGMIDSLKNNEKRKVSEINSLIKEFDKKNRFSCNPDSQNYELIMNSLKGINFPDYSGFDNLKSFEDSFLTEKELENSSLWYGDIEKPLWKHKDERVWIARRKKLLKSAKKHPQKERISNIVKELEERLTINAEDVGEVKLYEEKYDAKVSWFTCLWKLADGKILRELHTLRDTGLKEVNGYNIIKHETEKELIEAIKEKAKTFKPISFLGYNSVYDIIQSREAARTTKAGPFDVAIQNIEPRRDFVRKFMQRMKEDFIYIDLMWLNRIWFPFLRSKMPLGSHKLEDTAQYQGIDFKKSITYSEMRELEIKAISGKTTEIKQEAGKKLAEYASADVEPLKLMLEKQPFLSLLFKLKRIMPYATLTEIGFSPRIVDRYFDKKWFDYFHNMRFAGYEQKVHEDRIQIFKKRFASLKKDMLHYVGINTNSKFGKYPEYYQFYFPLEKWLMPFIFKRNREWEKLYNEVKDSKENFAFLQYLKAFSRELLVDYYFCKRERKMFEKSIRNFDKIDKKFTDLEKNTDRDERENYYWSFEHLKNQYRSIYVALDGKTRALIRKKQKDDKNLLFDFMTEIEEDNADLFALRKKAKEIIPHLKEGQQSVIKRFLSTFDRLDDCSMTLENKLSASDYSSKKDTVYMYNQKKRAEREERKFFNKYGFNWKEVENKMVESYKSLKEEIGNLNVIQIRGDYCFASSMPEKLGNSIIFIRNGKDFEITKEKTSEEEKLDELLFFDLKTG